MKKLWIGFSVFISIITWILAQGWFVHDTAVPPMHEGEISDQLGPVKILMSEPRLSNPDDLAKVKKYIEDNSGVNMEVINIKSEADFERQLNISLASGEDIDVVMLKSYENYLLLNEKNALMDIRPLLDKYGKNLLHQYPDKAWKSVTDKDGRILGIPKMADYGTEVVVVRKDWRERLGISPITTLEELEKYLIAVRDSDLDDNGFKDSIPLLSYSANNDYMDLDNSLLYLFTETNPNGNYMDADGNIIPVVMHPQYKDYLATLSRWHKEGLLYPDIYSIKRAQAEDLIVANKVGAIASWYTDHIRPLEKLRETYPQADYEYVHMKTLSGKPGAFRSRQKFSQRAAFLVNSKNAESAVQLFDWMLASKENYWSTKWGIYGEYWAWEDKEKELVKGLKGRNDPRSSYNKTYSMMYYSPWDFREKNPVFVDERYYQGKDYFQEKKEHFVFEPDWFVNYNLRGTAVYSSQQEARTLITENKVKIIVGNKPLDEWDEVIESYKKLYGNEYIETATQQYREKNQQ